MAVFTFPSQINTEETFLKLVFSRGEWRAGLYCCSSILYNDKSK